MFNLGAIGAGLGQGMQQIQQQQEQALRQQQMQMVMDQFQRTLRDRQLAGAALGAGGIPGFGGGGLPGMMQPGQQQPMQAMPQMGGAGQMAPPAAPAAPSPPPAAPPLAAGGKPTGVMPLEDDPASVALAGDTAKATGVPALDFDVEAEAPVGSPAPPTSAGGAGDSSAAPAHQPVSLKELPAWSQMFQHLDPMAIAHRIKEVRPDASDDAILGATEHLMKLGQGGLREQLAMANLMKALVGDQTRVQVAGIQADSRKDVAGMQTQSREGIAAANRDAAGTRLDKTLESREGIAGRREEGLNRRLESRITDKQRQQAMARADGQSKLALSEMHRQMNDIRQRIAILDAGPNATSGPTKITRDRLTKQFDDLAERERKRAEAVLKNAGESAE